MKSIVIASCLVLGLTGMASAGDPTAERLTTGTPEYWDRHHLVTDFEQKRTQYYCQPEGTLSSPLNASTAWGREIVDDIPTAVAGRWIHSIMIYVEEWSEHWQDPQGMILHLYDGSCPPPMAPYESLYFPWNDPAEMVTELA